MQTIIMIQNSIVSNMAVWDGVTTWNPGSQYTLIPLTDQVCTDGTPVQIGCSYDGTNFISDPNESGILTSDEDN